MYLNVLISYLPSQLVRSWMNCPSTVQRQLWTNNMCHLWADGQFIRRSPLGTVKALISLPDIYKVQHQLVRMMMMMMMMMMMIMMMMMLVVVVIMVWWCLLSNFHPDIFWGVSFTHIQDMCVTSGLLRMSTRLPACLTTILRKCKAKTNITIGYCLHPLTVYNWVE